MMQHDAHDLYYFSHSGDCGFRISLHIVADFPQLLVRFNCCSRVGVTEICP